MNEWYKKMQPKQAAGWWRRYKWTLDRWGCRTLYDCYKCPSESKEEVWKERYEEMYPYTSDRRVQKLTVVGAGMQTFSVAWIEMVVTDGDKQFMFRYDTAQASYWYPLEAQVEVEIEVEEDESVPVSIILQPAFPSDQYKAGCIRVKVPNNYQ